MIYSHEIRLQDNQMEPEQEPYLVILERLQVAYLENVFIFILPVEIEENMNRNLKTHHEIANRHFATALNGISIQRKIHNDEYIIKGGVL